MKRRGMTLLELIVVLAIGGVVLAVGQTTFATAIDRREQGARVAEREARVAGLRRTIVRWLDGSRPQLPDGVVSPAQELRVVTRASTPLGGPQTEVRLFIEGGLIAVLRPNGGADSLRIVLDAGATGMTTDYLVSSDSRREWARSDELGARAPVAVRLRIESTDSVAAEAFALPIEAPLASTR